MPAATPATPAPPFRTVLVANRGEIACRIIRTLRRLGIRSVAVFSDADSGAPHVRLADVAVRLGPAEPHASYLDVDAVLRAAKATGTDAVHPGYGFLSESPALARACAEAGIAFVGPPVRALEVMGDKIGAKAHVARSGVPVVPGTAEPGLSDDALVARAADVGYPLLVKPSAGGGGKGMTVVRTPDELPAALAAARRVAASAFGDDALLLERYLAAPRHIEVQVLADVHGAVVHLGERECSLQRRHQKVVEESPSPVVDARTRARLGEAACAVARSVGYVGAGTVELLVEAAAPEDFFFIEMNTRLQVEHPVTELVTGLDLVELQLRVAAGEPLGLTQDDVRLTGHAVEARVYAEDPARGFLPTAGRVLVLDEPAGEGVRVDSALAVGGEVGSTYDPMLSKVAAWGPDRATALARLDAALASTTVLGVTTNVAFLRRLVAHPEVRAGRLDTGLIERHLDELVAPAHVPDAALVAALRATADRAAPAAPTASAGSAWGPDGWRLGEHLPTLHVVTSAGGERTEVAVLGAAHDAQVRLDDAPPVRAGLTPLDGTTAQLTVDGVARTVRVASDGATTWVGHDGSAVALRVTGRLDALAEARTHVDRPAGSADPAVRSPMPGTVVAVDVATGDHVTAGQPLLTVEAMKMEHRLTATTDGVVTLQARPADRVTLDQVLATITPHGTDPTGHATTGRLTTGQVTTAPAEEGTRP
ncbi:biotin carboxylase N-terminal domain-containing protein [Cellulomonas cellasea]|uniref:biotin carboxylase n=1 Tax=Cellulomonas cellasea TaxID=43670 RepID=A0A7W4UCN6_9CELL|nr:biotin carboxylase N-terminal domain-containing protein [Cellulomonas cellasea]MBB2921780.1 acetyl-CoA/propionyl-CoA carboxylase biotin carboxyl carrier protein [Cellulomonas cellasea]